eukprot:7379760-Prymnesium_polylepis.8
MQAIRPPTSDSSRQASPSHRWRCQHSGRRGCAAKSAVGILERHRRQQPAQVVDAEVLHSLGHVACDTCLEVGAGLLLGAQEALTCNIDQHLQKFLPIQMAGLVVHINVFRQLLLRVDLHPERLKVAGPKLFDVGLADGVLIFAEQHGVVVECAVDLECILPECLAHLVDLVVRAVVIPIPPPVVIVTPNYHPLEPVTLAC